MRCDANRNLICSELLRSARLPLTRTERGALLIYLTAQRRSEQSFAPPVYSYSSEVQSGSARNSVCLFVCVCVSTCSSAQVQYRFVRVASLLSSSLLFASLRFSPLHVHHSTLASAAAERAISALSGSDAIIDISISSGAAARSRPTRNRRVYSTDQSAQHDRVFFVLSAAFKLHSRALL